MEWPPECINLPTDQADSSGFLVCRLPTAALEVRFLTSFSEIARPHLTCKRLNATDPWYLMRHPDSILSSSGSVSNRRLLESCSNALPPYGSYKVSGNYAVMR